MPLPAGARSATSGYGSPGTLPILRRARLKVRVLADRRWRHPAVTMRLAGGLAALGGLCVAMALIAHQGLQPVLDSLSRARWGVLWIALFHLIPLAFLAQGWRALLVTKWRGSIGMFFRARWIRDAVNDLLPVAQVGGQLIGARLLTFDGATPGIAVAGAVADMTVELLAQLLFTLVGLGLLLQSSSYDRTAHWLVVGVAVAVPALCGFVLAQRGGLFKLVETMLERLAETSTRISIGRVTGLHDTIRAIYRDHRGLLSSAACHLLAWMLGAGEAWFALHLMGSPAGLREAIILESLGQAVRSAAFVVPAGLGVQEGGYMLVGGMLGLGPEVALAVSLVRRARDLLLGLPALLVWQIAEGRLLWLAFSRARRRGDR
jgi:putative membrane protein